MTLSNQYPELNFEYIDGTRIPAEASHDGQPRWLLAYDPDTVTHERLIFTIAETFERIHEQEEEIKRLKRQLTIVYLSLTERDAGNDSEDNP